MDLIVFFNRVGTIDLFPRLSLWMQYEFIIPNRILLKILMQFNIIPEKNPSR